MILNTIMRTQARPPHGGCVISYFAASLLLAFATIALFGMNLVSTALAASPEIEGPWATAVTAESASLGGKVDPHNASTEYRLEYGPDTSYGNVVAEGTLASGEAPVFVGHHIQHLRAATTYHYRLTAHSQFGETVSIDRTFTTQFAQADTVLADERAWELVSPANKHGALIENGEGGYDIQAAANGQGIAYVANEPLTEDVEGRPWSFQEIISRRIPTGWGSEEVTVPATLLKGASAGLLSTQATLPPDLFSADLSRAVVSPGAMTPPLSGEATERTLYLRNNDICASDPSACYMPLVTRSNIPPNTFFGSEYESMLFMGGSPDLSHVVFEDPVALTPEAHNYPISCEICETLENLYEWHDGKLELVNVFGSGAGRTSSPEGKYAFIGGPEVHETVAHAVSENGHRIVWSYKPTDAETIFEVRDMAEESTVQIGVRGALFQTMNADGSRIFYLQGGDLRVLRPETRQQTDITANYGPGEASARVLDAIIGTAEDGSEVYFVAKGLLASGASPGQPNLYIAREEGGRWRIALIATLSVEDEKDWFAPIRNTQANDLGRVTARVSRNGRYVVFMSNRSLTGYDNTDASSGQRDEEVYLYDAVSGQLSCVSCAPTGARPTGRLYAGQGPLVDKQDAWQNHWIAANVPAWNRVQTTISVYQPRYLLDDGRVFFDSSDALASQDTNGMEDVYEYEPVDVGSCGTSSPVYSEHNGGCVSLISSGTASDESAFYDAGENGNDSFFVTSAKLTSADYDNGFDVYDAHICSTVEPCLSGRVQLSPPPCATADACRAVSAVEPETFGAPPSTTFSGGGNVPTSFAANHPARVTRGQRLSRARKRCRERYKDRRNKRRRCEQAALRQHVGLRVRKAHSTRSSK